MILKKPYAFLIKYFRAIHFLLMFLLITFSFKGRSILQFFNNYVKNNYQTSVTTDLHNLYAPISLVLTVLLIIILSGTLLGLMIRKKKPYRLYLFTILYYLLIFIGLFYIRSVLASFSESMLGATTARSLRDILIIISFPQYAFILSIFLRAIGFDLKKFDFASDLREMNYSSKDAEEFEVNINLDVYKAEQKVRRLLRELVYYVKENKFIMIIAGIIGLIVLFNFIHNNTHGNYDQVYRMNKTFTYEKVDVTFQDAIISNLDYRGNLINGKYFLAIKINMFNGSGASVKMDYNNFKLDLGSRMINPTVNDAKYFIDVASSVIPTTITHRANHTFVLVYELSQRDINQIKRIVIHNGAVYDKGKYIDKHIFVNLKIKKINEVEKAGDYSIDQNVVFEKSMLKNTSLMINSQSIYKRYIYKYTDCISKENCGLFDDMLTIKSGIENDVILVLEGEYTQDANIGYTFNYSSLSAFASNFCSIQYRISGELFTKAVNITPINATNFIAFEVPQNVEYADLIQLIITIRDKRYYININP